MYHRPNIISKPLRCARRASYTYEVRKVKLATSTNCAIYLYVTHSTAAVGREKVGKGQKKSQYAGKRNLRKRIYQFFFFFSSHSTEHFLSCSLSVQKGDTLDTTFPPSSCPSPPFPSPTNWKKHTVNKKQDITKWRTRPLKPACVRNCTREMQQEGL